MKTLPREPWRGSQICGYQTNVGGWSEGEPEFCGEFKKTGSPVCDVHDEQLREENGGELPRFAPGNTLGMEASQEAVDEDEFELRWEPYEGDTPIEPTEDELRVYTEQFP